MKSIDIYSHNTPACKERTKVEVNRDEGNKDRGINHDSAGTVELHKGEGPHIDVPASVLCKKVQIEACICWSFGLLQ